MKTVTPIANRLMIATGLCALLGLPNIGHAESSIEAIAIESATTPEQFQALADHYKAKAAEARQAVATHKAMANSMLNSKSPNADSSMRAHCTNLVATYEKAAAEYDAMASDFAAKAGKK